MEEQFSTSHRPKVKPLCEDEEQILAHQYQIITNNVYQGQGETEVLHEIKAVGIFLEFESQMYNLFGVMKKIHQVFIIEQYDDFKYYELIAYIRLMHYDIDEDILEKGVHIEIAYMLLQKQYERLEKLRIHKYINHVLFQPMLKKPGEFPGILFWYEEPSKSEIIKKGYLYYYPRTGEITIDVLTDMFDYTELFHLAMIFGQQRAGKNKFSKTDKNDILFTPTNVMTLEDMARAVMLFVEDAGFDPRVFLTPQGFNNTFIQEESERPISINPDVDFSYESLIVACSAEGMEIRDSESNEMKPIEVLFEEYTVMQLSPAFMSHVGEHRSPYGAVRRHRTSSGEFLYNMALGEILFYGKRDGISPVDVYTLKELYYAFDSNDSFWDPESLRLWPTNSLMWVSFSRVTLKRLLTKVLPKMDISSEYSKHLSKVVQRLLSDDQMSKRSKRLQKLLLDDIRKNSDDELKSFLIRMFNVGNIYRELDEMVDTYDPDLIARMMMVNPISVPPEPKWTGRIRAELRDLMMRIHETYNDLDKGMRALVERLRVFRYWGDNLHVNYEDDQYTIGVYLEIAYDMIKLGLFRQLKIVGVNMMMTSNYYHKMIFGLGLTDIQIEHTEVTIIGDNEVDFELENFL